MHRIACGALLLTAVASPSSYAQAPDQRIPTNQDSIRIWAEDLGGGWLDGRIARAAMRDRPICTGIQVDYAELPTGHVIIFYRDIDSLLVRPRSLPAAADADWVFLDPKRLADREPGCGDEREGPEERERITPGEQTGG